MKRREIYIAERAQGKTYRQIAEEYGVSFQGVYSAVNYSRRTKEKIRRWKRLSLWMEENNKTEADLTRLLGCSTGVLCVWRTGKGDPSMHYINKLLEVTGIPYEELFAE
jgi:transcriptional regulator with XRE-family HTH domain